jgi:hypothetical protein
MLETVFICIGLWLLVSGIKYRSPWNPYIDRAKELIKGLDPKSSSQDDIHERFDLAESDLKEAKKMLNSDKYKKEVKFDKLREGVDSLITMFADFDKHKYVFFKLSEDAEKDKMADRKEIAGCEYEILRKLKSLKTEEADNQNLFILLFVLLCIYTFIKISF